MNDKSDTLALEKVPSGIKGFDDITSGGFPKARTTLILGGPGCGKSVLALQALIGGTTRHDTPGIFVAFEENAERIRAKARSFGWNIDGRQKSVSTFSMRN